MRELIHLLKLTEKELKISLYNYLLNKKMSPVLENGFIYAKGDIPIMLVAHMDTVFEKPPKKLRYNKKNDVIFSHEGGIGGDDRCGIYAIIKILEELRPHVLFTEAEEIGGIGAIRAIQKLPKPNIKYIIEFDRKGNNDCVFYDCENQAFIDYIESFGFETAWGTFSDISILGKEWNIAAVNLSIGYYEEHTADEYIKFKELKNNINRVKLILQQHQQAKYFDYQERKSTTQDDNLLYGIITKEDFLMFLENYYGAFETEEAKNKGPKLTLHKQKKKRTKDGEE